MGKIDIDSERLLKFLVASCTMNQRKISESEKSGDWYHAEMAMARRSAVLSVFQLAIRERTASEEEAARSIVDSGEARMALFLPEPEWWQVLTRCCGALYTDHIEYQSGDDDDIISLCPIGRGYWQLARGLLAGLPIHLRAIAQRSARNIAPRWTHWAVVRKEPFRV